MHAFVYVPTNKLEHAFTASGRMHTRALIYCARITFIYLILLLHKRYGEFYVTHCVYVCVTVFIFLFFVYISMGEINHHSKILHASMHVHSSMHAFLHAQTRSCAQVSMIQIYLLDIIFAIII